MSEYDPICDICKEPYSAHVPGPHGPRTHPREARGEGTYRLVRAGYTQGGFMPGDVYEVPALYEFIFSEKENYDG